MKRGLKYKIQRKLFSTGQMMKKGLFTPQQALERTAGDFIREIYYCERGLNDARETAKDGLEMVTECQQIIDSHVSSGEQLDGLEKLKINTALFLTDGQDASMLSRMHSIILCGGLIGAFENRKNMCPDPSFDWSYEHLIDTMLNDPAAIDFIIDEEFTWNKLPIPEREVFMHDRETVEKYMNIFIRYAREMIDNGLDGTSVFFNENGFIRNKDGTLAEEDFFAPIPKLDLKGFTVD